MVSIKITGDCQNFQRVQGSPVEPFAARICGVEVVEVGSEQEGRRQGIYDLMMPYGLALVASPASDETWKTLINALAWI
jgi:hypothetical protein